LKFYECGKHNSSVFEHGQLILLLDAYVLLSRNYKPFSA